MTSADPDEIPLLRRFSLIQPRRLIVIAVVEDEVDDGEVVATSWPTGYNFWTINQHL